MCGNAMHGLLFVVMLWGAGQPDSPQGAMLTVRVEPDKLEVVLGEPLFITVTAVNEGTHPMKLIHHNAPTYRGSSVVDLRIGRDTDHMKRWDDGLRPVSRRVPKTLQPGESVSVVLVMLYNRKAGFWADAPGTYWISGRAVVVANPYVEILSEPVKIEVREPLEKDRSTWEWLDAHKDEYGRLVQIPWMAELPEEFVQACAQKAETSESTYEGYVALSLSRWYRDGTGKDAQQAARFARIAKRSASSDRVRAEAEKLLLASKARSTP